jgi:hypothetical protein
VLGGVAALGGVVLIGQDGFEIIRYVLSILAAILAVFAYQAKQWLWLPILGAVVVLWNPVFPIELPDGVWFGLQYAATAAFIAAATTIRVRLTEDPGARDR